MKLAHLSDSHLGFCDLDLPGDDGTPLREQDFYDAFARAIDAIIAARPDAVIHAGDLFHRASPSNRALTEGLRQLKRLADARIPTVVLAGNHDAPRTAFTGPIIAALESIDGVVPLYQPRRQTAELGELAIHAVPHIVDEALFAEEIAGLAPLPGKLNVLALHVSAGSQFLMDKFGEQVLDAERQKIFGGFAYTALGHWHGHRVLKGPGTACYSGSTEIMRDTEVGERKGWVLVDLSDPAHARIEFQPVAIRTQYAVVVEACAEKTDLEILGELRAAAEKIDRSGAIVRVKLADLASAQGAALTNRAAAEPFASALTTIVTCSFVSGASSEEVVDLKTTSLTDLFARHLEEQLPDAERRARVLALGKRYLQEAEQ